MEKSVKTNNNAPKYAGFFLRLWACFYDFLIILAVLMIGAGVVVAIGEAFLKAGFIHYEHYIDTAGFLTNHPIASPLFKAYLLTLWIGFFVFFWCRGQTLGMRAWGLIIVNYQGGNITFRQAFIRVITSAFGISNVVALFDPQRRGLQDILAKTHVIKVKKG